MKASMMDRRSFLAGALALAASPSAAFAQERSFAQDLQGAGFEFYKGNEECMNGLLWVYAGVPEVREDIFSCGDDLSYMQGMLERIKGRGIQTHIQPVFLFREGQGENLDKYIDPKDSPFVALQAPQDNFIQFVMAHRLGFIRQRNDVITDHSRYIILMKQSGEIVPVKDINGQYRNGINATDFLDISDYVAQAARGSNVPIHAGCDKPIEPVI